MWDLQRGAYIVRSSGFPRGNLGFAHRDAPIVERYVVGVGIACGELIRFGLGWIRQCGSIVLSVERHFKFKRGVHYLRENDDLRSGGTAQLHGNRRFGGCGYGSRSGSRVESAFVLQPIQCIARRFRFAETDAIVRLEGELDETHAVVEGVVRAAFSRFVGEAHLRFVGAALGSRCKEKIDARALLVGCGADGQRSADRLIRIVGIEGLRFGVIEIDGLILGHELAALSHVGHVGVACTCDADAVAVGPVGSFLINAGGRGNISDKPGSYGASNSLRCIQFLSTTEQRQRCRRCTSEHSKSFLYRSVHYIPLCFCFFSLFRYLSLPGYSSALASKESPSFHSVISLSLTST